MKNFHRRPVTLFLFLGLAAALLWLSPAGPALADKAVIDEDVQLGEGIREPYTGDLNLKKRKAVFVGTTYSSFTYFTLPDATVHGFEYGLFSEYQKAMNKKLGKKSVSFEVVFMPMSADRLIPSLNAGYIDVAAAGLTVTRERKKLVDFTDPYLSGFSEVVVTHKSVTGLKSVDDLSGRKVHVRLSSSYRRSLDKLNKRLKKAGRKPVEIIEAGENLNTGDILELVNAGVEHITVVDSHIAGLWSSELPDVVIHKKLTLRTGGRLAWMVRKNNPELKASLNEFIKGHKKGTLLGNIYFKRYFQSTKWITNPIREDSLGRMRQYIQYIKRYAKEYGLDPLLIGALGFTESGWDHNKVSRVGAVGVMQLMPSLAKDTRVAIPDIYPVENNIHAGVKYLALLRRVYFDDPAISPDNQIRFSLAAYNAGPSRVATFRKKAKKMGYNPDVWFGNVELAALKVVGTETVRYVRKINKYFIALKLTGDVLEARQEQLDAATEGKKVD